MSVFATLTLQVVVELEEDPGAMTPDAHEPPYDYLAVRRVEPLGVELDSEATEETVALIEASDAYDGLDPDGLLTAAVAKSLEAAVRASTDARVVNSKTVNHFTVTDSPGAGCEF